MTEGEEERPENKTSEEWLEGEFIEWGEWGFGGEDGY